MDQPPTNLDLRVNVLIDLRAPRERVRKVKRLAGQGDAQLGERCLQIGNLGADRPNRPFEVLATPISLLF
ncbi:MAG: hypothetical protein WBQ55_01375 [Xanthobacteraceae bacterium]